MEPLDHLSHNRNAWDRLAQSGNRFAKPASEKDMHDPLGFVDGPGWLGKSIAGKKILCLAAGGGRQGPVYAAAGAQVTVVDISPAMLQLDQQVAEKRGLNIRTLETSMDNLSALGNATFDIVIHPVSSCYIPTLGKLFSEVARVIADQGIYISQHKQPISLQASIRPDTAGYHIEHEADRTQSLPEPSTTNLIREPGTLEYIHSFEAIIGGMCRAGFSVADLIEPKHGDIDADSGSFEHRSRYINPYLRIKAIRSSGNRDQATTSAIWSPD